MKALLFVVTLCIIGSSYAAESETDCPAMNESREHSTKTKTEVTKTRSEGSTAQ